MYDKCYFCLDQLPKLKKESTASFFVNFGGAGVQKSRPTLLYFNFCHSLSEPVLSKNSRASTHLQVSLEDTIVLSSMMRSSIWG